MDATRTLHGQAVALKRIKRGELASQPANHCAPVYEVLTLDTEHDRLIVVMPLLRPYKDPKFDTIGEAVECFRQLFEGIQFMHKHRVAHRDCVNRHIMSDPTHLYLESFHAVAVNPSKDYSGGAKHFTRTQRLPKYHFIDFGISRRYDPSDLSPKEIPIWGGDNDVPELQRPLRSILCNAFKRTLSFNSVALSL